MTLIVALLAGGFSSPAMHAMPMADTVGVVSQDASALHDCCDEAEQQSMPSSCEQHCAGQIGLVSVLTQFPSASFFTLFERREMALWQRNEPLIRPPKLMVA